MYHHIHSAQFRAGDQRRHWPDRPVGTWECCERHHDLHRCGQYTNTYSHFRLGRWHIRSSSARSGRGNSHTKPHLLCERNWNGCAIRSEEHTSELQSHVNLVCRLLLEKKKKNKIPN